MPKLAKVIALFLDKDTGLPLSGDEYQAHLFDKDKIVDDFLGITKLKEGRAELVFNLGEIESLDSISETKPDLYLFLLKNNQTIFETKVFEDVDFSKEDNVSGEKIALTKNLGTFKV